MLRTALLASWFVFLTAWSATGAEPAATAPPAVGDTAPDFSLPDVTGQTVRLSEQYARGPVVLIVLRGYPGYQCPFCTTQFADLLSAAKDFEKQGATVLIVYPGSADRLDAHARKFIGDKKLPKDYLVLLDSDFVFTEAYHLRWNAPNETAYPSSFVIDRGGKALYAHVSKEHGGRTSTKDLLAALPKPAQ